MLYSLELKVYDNVEGLPGAYASAVLTSSDQELAKTRGWIDKEFPTKENLEEFFRELVMEFLPEKSAPNNQEVKKARGRKST